jgi:hypothetical protein
MNGSLAEETLPAVHEVVEDAGPVSNTHLLFSLTLVH